MMALLWRDALDDIAAARMHFREALAIFDDPGFAASGAPDYLHRMAFQHAMQSGYTSFESALKRMFALLEEPLPVGPDWHFALVRRASEAMESGRPPILGADLAAAAVELMRFRHVAMHGYDRFDVRKAAIAADEARRFLETIDGDIAAFRRAVDP
jgi:hypothetical protein